MSRSAGRRRRGRELALRVLFELEGTEKEPRPALEYQADDMGAPRDDAAISEASVNWDLVDYGKVERAVLRLGTYEVLYEPATPVAVSIDESLELARVYAGEEAVPLVNGVLGRIARERV